MLIGLITLLSNSIFFGENNYSKRNVLVKEYESQLQKNNVSLDGIRLIERVRKGA